MIHEHGYWLAVEGPNTHVCDEQLSQALINMFDKEYIQIVDIGCGDGSYTRAFLNAGINCIGYDGSPLTPELTDNICHVRDFSQPVNIGLFDVVLSLEVGEHIPKEYEQNFIDNLCNASEEWIVLSWAVEGQPGYGHINCQNNDYVIKELHKRGFKIDRKKTSILRKKSTLPWFKDTLMVFNYGLEK